jgi:hypothetical protein
VTRLEVQVARVLGEVLTAITDVLRDFGSESSRKKVTSPVS